MIIASDKDTTSVASSDSQSSMSGLENQTVKLSGSSDGASPPTYEDAMGSDHINRFPVPQGLNPVNYIVQTTSHDSLKEKYLLDPTMRIPPSLLPPVSTIWGTEEERANLKAESDYSSVNVEVWVDSRAARERPSEALSDEQCKRAIIRAKSSYSSAVLKVHSPSQERQHSLDITCTSSYSSATLYIPRNFRGILISKTSYGSVKLSPAISRNCTMLGGNSERKCFLGDISAYAADEDSGNWDQALVQSDYSSVSVYYDDEDGQNGIAKLMSTFEGNPPDPMGFFRKIFGMS